MALRNVVKYGDPILRKKSRTVEVFDRRIATLVEDMFETMYKDNGVGLAAVQVGILKRIVVIDCGDGPVELINPEIVKTEGEQCGQGLPVPARSVRDGAPPPKGTGERPGPRGQMACLYRRGPKGPGILS